MNQFVYVVVLDGVLYPDEAEDSRQVVLKVPVLKETEKRWYVKPSGNVGHRGVFSKSDPNVFRSPHEAAKYALKYLRERRDDALRRAKLEKAKIAYLVAQGQAGEELYYIQNTRKYVGNCVLWWGENDNGYTCELKKAGTYTRLEALERTNPSRFSEPTTRAFRTSEVDQLVVEHVRAEPLHDLKALGEESDGK